MRKGKARRGEKEEGRRGERGEEKGGERGEKGREGESLFVSGEVAGTTCK